MTAREDDPVWASRHAKHRFKERVKLPRRALRRMANNALKDGLDPLAPGVLSKGAMLRLKSAAARNVRADDNHVECRFMRLFHDYVFVFSDTGGPVVLVTVFPSPESVNHDAT